jgi:hypothetical protein
MFILLNLRRRNHMTFMENDLLKQRQDFELLQEEFSRLSARFGGMLREGGLSEDDLKKYMEKQHSSELEKLLEQAKAEAARAGQARAAQAGSVAPAASAQSTGRGRPGAVKI